MKSAAALASFLVLSLYFNLDKTQTTPALRALRSNDNTEDNTEMIKDHHHHIRKVKKIAIPVPVGVPQYIPIPVSVPSTVIDNSNSAVVSPPTTIGINPVGAGGGAPGVPGVGGPTSPVVTPAPTTMAGRPLATPAATTTRRPSATPAPTNAAIDRDSRTQQLRPVGVPTVADSSAGGGTGFPMSRNFGSTNTNIPSGTRFDPLGATNGFPPNVGGGFGGNPMTGFGGNGIDFAQVGANRFDGRSNFGLARNNGLGTGNQFGAGGVDLFGGFNRRERQRRR